jgi:hypothetical protein
MVRFHGVFIDLPHVLEGQIVQESKPDPCQGHCDGRLREKEERAIRERIIRNRLDPFKFRSNVAALERTKNGKLRAVISEFS